MKVLYVLYENTLVGELRLIQGDRYEFQYEDRWLNKPQAFSISLALSLQKEPHEHKVTKSFFEGLVPEGDLLRQLTLRSSEPISSAFDFLAAYGRDCAGALTIQESPSLTQSLDEQQTRVTWEDLSKSFKEKKTLAEVILNEDGGFFSLAGAQDKIPIIKNSDGLFVSNGSIPTTHIIKPPNRYHPDALDSVYNEHFCMRLAAAAGLNVPTTEIVEDEVSFYIIERYDRTREGKKILRLHQQDFCQAQGILNSQKYEIQGGPSIKDNYMLIMQHSAQVIEDSKAMLQWIFFNLLIGNNDSHSKNLSFLMLNQDLIISPFYDLICTSIYPTIRKKFAFKFAGQMMWSEIDSKHLRAVEKDLKLKSKFLSSLLAELIENLKLALPTTLSEMEKYREKIVFEKLNNEIERRLKHFTHLSGE